MSNLREKMETHRFLRSLAEARRRYSGYAFPFATRIEREPAPPLDETPDAPEPEPEPEPRDDAEH